MHLHFERVKQAIQVYPGAGNKGAKTDPSVDRKEVYPCQTSDLICFFRTQRPIT